MAVNKIITENLNKEQLEAVVNSEGYNRIIAGAGAGKTRTLIYKYAYLVSELGIDPQNILAVTFTNKAAREMKKRAKELLGDTCLENAMIYTFHGLCARMLREDGDGIGWPSNFNILDNSDKKLIIKNIIEDNELRKKYNNIRIDKILTEVDKMKILFKDDIIFGLVYDKFRNNFQNVYEEVFTLYLKKEKSQFSLDYNDLMPLALRLLNNNEVLMKWQNKVVYILVDEYQDTDKYQNKLLHLLQEKYKNLTVVGDPDQNIYSWRGSDNRYIVDFNYQPKKDFYVITNYRSTPQILSNANSLIKHNSNRLKKDLKSVLPNGDKVVHYYAKSLEEEAKFVSDNIKKLVSTGIKPSDIAILYRASFLSRCIEQALIKEGISYCVYSGIRFFEREEIKDIISYLKLINQDKIDDLSLLRIINKPSRNLSNRKVKELKRLSENYKISCYELIKEESSFRSDKVIELLNIIKKYRIKKDEYQSLWQLVKDYLDEVGYTKYRQELAEQERLDNIKELMNSIITYEDDNKPQLVSLNDYLQEVALYTNVDENTKANYVSLMTIHASKGLEFKVIFSIGWNDGILPSSKSLEANKNNGLEEERRLAYVGITRAMNKLFITNSDYNYGKKGVPSRFLLELDEENLERINTTREELEVELNKKNYNFLEVYNNEIVVYEVGNIVYHNVFGKGIIQSIEGTSLLVKFNGVSNNLIPILNNSKCIKLLEKE